MEGYITIGKIDISSDKLINLHNLNSLVSGVRGFLYSEGILYANADNLTTDEIDTIITGLGNI